MDIYIYGSDSFKNKIHTVLDHGNIRFKIDNGNIITVYKLEDLKSAIKQDPHQIYLIDQNKIIEDDFIAKYLKFLVPKDAIEKKFLDQNGAGDISLRDFDDLAIYLTKRLESPISIRPKANEITTIDDIFDLFEDDTEKDEIKVDNKEIKKD